MSREIKFRAWIKTTKEMITQETISDYILVSNGTGFGVIDGSDDSEYGTGTVWLEDKDFELMQFTGLKDKNGKEIYEGDIVYAHDWSDKCLTCDKKLYEEGNVTGEVTYQDGAYHIGGSNIWFTKNREVIGNIYENPEFLTKKKLRSEL